MSTECRDECFLYMISCFRPRLKQYIRVMPVLDRLPSLSREDREKVRVAAEQRGDVEGAEELLRAVERGPRDPGWFPEFVQALEYGGCDLAARYLNSSQLPSPTEEADHDLCVQLVQLLHATLVDKMRARQVAEMCLQMNIFQEEDLERVSGPFCQAGHQAVPQTLATPRSCGAPQQEVASCKCKKLKGGTQTWGRRQVVLQVSC